mgnify:FL=1
MDNFGNIKVGIASQRSVVVEEKHTVSHTKNAILSTPKMIAFMETVSASLVQPLLPAGFVTVGFEVNIRHKAPSKLGSEIIVSSKVLEVDGRKLLFEVQVQQGEITIGEGLHRRTIISIQR